mmetsp:Transcript_2987/g.4206  ORF Transcript_2987/g.4206 Transcript_2987/m.4206 type:complete len:80 (+) Transcript_2987:122-361(+)|eukprot:CAMPEP_0184862272 /NCGR_PEP_ID=MMETSP0580-20130426/6750_1 /TAXON_ID=1118495 /ORGANISM="Dactyliosolen fragilissimus" /LENGTH=79 /DNA_ID=CAMNT_0027360047 /DNA_START=78 /DNA_END=317 /DNA_ORIENTATION=-
MFKTVVIAAVLASASAFAPASSTFGVRTALSAEWTPADGSAWVEKDYVSEISKLEKEAAERLDEKIAELQGNLASVGKP